MIRSDTIAAVATAPGKAGVAVVRVSGSDAFALAGLLVGSLPAAPGMALRRLRHPNGTFIDEALVLAFKSPRSYTGEDVVEFQCHGGVTSRRVLEACFAAGARLARRGEFTERAFLNGKLDYDQAESVLDLIEAKTERAADAALEGLSGGKRQEHRELYETALSLSAEVEHSLDIDEGELGSDFVSDVSAKVAQLRKSLADAVRRNGEGRILREGALVALAGRPNVGKSSLMNALLATDRAIVSDIPGTTRDSIEEWLDLDGWPVRLVDTAGLRETDDAIEAEGVRRAGDVIAKADVVLRLYDSAEPPAAGEREILVRTKCDLGPPGAGPEGELAISTLTGEGMEDLRNALSARLESLAGDGERSAGATSDALLRALSMVPDDSEFTDDADLVLIGNRLRLLAETLAVLVGARYSEDLLDNLFSRFCVGK